jgi:F0F1-type ATP synthase membrane subunit c/vacuolar-type H+-ATPase subunit K
LGSVFGVVRLAQIAMLVSIVLYVAVGELIGRTAAANNALFYTLSLASISTLGAALVVRRTLVLPAEALLREKPTDPLVQARWRTAYIFLYALCEALALFGLILRIAGFTLVHVWGFYLGGFLLLLLFSPRVPQSQIR